MVSSRTQMYRMSVFGSYPVVAPHVSRRPPLRRLRRLLTQVAAPV